MKIVSLTTLLFQVITLLGEFLSMQKPLGIFVLLAVVPIAFGCANNTQSNPYAYAAPYAPPVYPQASGYAQPAAYAGSPNGLPAGAISADALPPGAIIAPPIGRGLGPVSVSSAPVGVVEGGQTPPCPPTYTPQ